VINAKRVLLDAVRRRWLFRHRDLFQPLLPSTTFFDALHKEMAEAGENVSYVPFHALTEQPKLIEGGEMKDYQVGCRMCCYCAKIVFGRVLMIVGTATRIGVPCIYVQ
jgi:hypothetical protein